MRRFKIKRVGDNPMQWTAWGKNAAEALAQWERCFGTGFEIVGEEPALAEG